MKLWEKGYQLDSLVEKYMTGDDPELDLALVPYDCLGSIAHCKMLEKIGILTTKESALLIKTLNDIITLAQAKEFVIEEAEEDVHTAVENYLVKHCGNVGKKLHTARSRNDQVLVDLRLYTKDWLLKVIDEALLSVKTLCKFAENYAKVPIPGRTHFQRAMSSSLGLWAGAFAESLLDDVQMLKSAYEIIDQCPLGSAASYGVALPIDRQLTADLLGFNSVQNNVLYVNNSRGKFEAIVLNALVHVMNTLSKIATDIILFSAPEFAYFALPEKFCPGSSLMPQKRNPCPLELMRAKSATIQGMLLQVLEIGRGLPSGYNRDFQETKRPLMQGLELTLTSLQVFTKVFMGLEVLEENCLAAFTPEIFATDKVLHLVQRGIAFRDAYRQVAENIEQVKEEDPLENILSKTHLGATGNLGVALSYDKMANYQKWKEALLD